MNYQPNYNRNKNHSKIYFIQNFNLEKIVFKPKKFILMNLHVYTMANKKEKQVTVKSVCTGFFMFVTVFFGTFIGLWFLTKYKKIAHCHILSPLEEEMHIWPEYHKFFNKYRNRFNIVYRNVSKTPFLT